MNKAQVIAQIQALPDFFLEFEEKAVNALGNIVDYKYVVRDKRGQITLKTDRLFIKDVGLPTEECIIDRSQQILPQFQAQLNKFSSHQIIDLDLESGIARFRGIKYNSVTDLFEEKEYFAEQQGQGNGKKVVIKELNSHINLVS